MAYKAKLPVRKEKDIFELPMDETATGESFEMKQSKDFYELPDSNTKEFENDNVFESKEEKDAKIFELPKNETEGEDTLYRTSEKEIIDDINQELEGYGKPLKVINRNTLEVSANGVWHKVTRNDLYEYQKSYHLDGQDGRSIQRYRTFAKDIQGDDVSLDTLALDVKNTFQMLDEKSGSYETLESEY